MRVITFGNAIVFARTGGTYFEKNIATKKGQILRIYEMANEIRTCAAVGGSLFRILFTKRVGRAISLDFKL